MSCELQLRKDTYFGLVDTKTRSVFMNPTYPSEASKTAVWLIGTPCSVSTEGSPPFEVYLPSRFIQGRWKRPCPPMNLGVSVRWKTKEGRRKRTPLLVLKFPTGLPVSLLFMLICICLILKHKILTVDHLSSLSSVFSEKGFGTVVRCLKLGVAKLWDTTPQCLWVAGLSC